MFSCGLSYSEFCGKDRKSRKKHANTSPAPAAFIRARISNHPQAAFRHQHQAGGEEEQHFFGRYRHLVFQCCCVQGYPMGQSVSVARDSASEVVATVRRDFTVIESFATSRKGSKWFPGLAKRLSKDKPAAAVHHLTSEAERTCYDWCKGAVDPPSRALIKLLHSDAGWTVLEYVMRGCKARWWLDVVDCRRKAKILDDAISAAQGKFEF